jgi:CSLREA domain-containing protein
MGAIAMLFLGVSGHPQSALAENITVTTTADTNSGQCSPSLCSLRQAIIHANLTPGQDTITLPAGTYLFHLAGTGESTAGSGDLDIWEDVIITGDGQGSTIVDGNHLDGVFEVLPDAQVVISNLTVRNGLRSEATGNGAGILNMGNLTLTNVTVSGNQSSNGGGISNGGQMTMNNVSVSSNSAVTYGGTQETGYGGGIFNNTDANLTISNSTFTNNAAQRNGAGIFSNTDARLAIHGTSSFSGNTSLAYGGAISNSGDLSVADTSFDQNTADDGGAIANLRGGDMFITYATFAGNLANGSNLGGGGAIFNYQASATVSASDFTGNISYGEGGGAINSTGVLNVANSTLDGNEARIHASFDPVGEATSPGLGGALYFINGSEVTLVSNSISGNQAGTAGGAIYNDPGSILKITSCLLDGNRVVSGGSATHWYGGGIHNGGTLSLNLSTLSNNLITSGASLGGGMCIFANGSATITNTTISGNSASAGGGISHQGTGILTIRGSTISGNSATGIATNAYGGGLHSDKQAVITNSTLSGNHSAFVGGAIAANGTAASISLSNVTITNNTANNSASAIFNWEGTVDLVNTVIDGSCNYWHMAEGTFVGDENNSSPVDDGGNVERPGNTCALTSPFSKVNVADPLFALLADNDGPTRTHVPLFSSVLIDQGKTVNCPAVDQSGAMRPFDALGDLVADCDTGSVEYGSSSQNTVSGLITRYYTTILGRAPDAGGLSAWKGEMARLVTLGMDGREGFIILAKMFFNSAEYLNLSKSNGAYVTDLYATFFDRSPAPAETAYWTDRIVNGVSRNTVMNYFVFSSEFDAYMQDRLGIPVARPENNLVNDFYRGLLSRTPDDSGYNYWLDSFQTAQCNADADSISSLAYQVASLFTTLPEYTGKNRTSTGFVEDIYDGIMRRDGDAAGINYWANEIASGNRSRDQVLQFFTASTEFQDRVENIIHAGCLP